MGLRVKRVTRRLPECDHIRQLYVTAFPADERAPFWLMLKRACRENIDFLAFYDDGQFVGMTYIIRGPGMAYVFYLAIDDSARGRGYGSRILRMLRKHYRGQNLFLAIEELDPEAENYEQRVSRRRFYERNGLHLLKHKIREGNVVYAAMGTGDEIDGKAYVAMLHGYLGVILSRLVKIDCFY